MNSGGEKLRRLGTHGSESDHQTLLGILLQSLNLFDNNDVSGGSLDAGSKKKAQK